MFFFLPKINEVFFNQKIKKAIADNCARTKIFIFLPWKRPAIIISSMVNRFLLDQTYLSIIRPCFLGSMR